MKGRWCSMTGLVAASLLLAGCADKPAEAGTDEGGDPFEGEYKEWLDFRGRQVVVQGVAIRVEGTVVVANITLENLGHSTPGVDAEPYYLPMQFHADSFGRRGYGGGSSESHRIYIDSAPSNSSQVVRFGFDNEDGDQQRVGPLAPGETLTIKAIFSVHEKSLREGMWRLQVEDYYTGCVGQGLEEIYSSWGDEDENDKCSFTYDHCGYTHDYSGSIDWYDIRDFMVCVPRPLEAIYYGDPADAGIPPVN